MILLSANNICKQFCSQVFNTSTDGLSEGVNKSHQQTYQQTYFEDSDHQGVSGDLLKAKMIKFII